MSWVKLDDQFFAHPKVVGLSKDAKLLYLAGLTYCSSQLTDGVIVAGAVRIVASLAGTSERAVNDLVRAGLWVKEEGAYMVHDYLDYQPSAERVKHNRAGNASRQDTHRARRNGVTEPLLSPQSNAVTNGVSHAESNALLLSSRARSLPAPTPEEIVTPGNTPIASGGVGGSGGADAPTKPARAKPRGSRAPDDFELTEAHYDRAAEYGVPLDRVDAETTRFLDHHRAKGTVFQDWQAAWRTWMQRAAEYAVRPVPIRGGRSVNQVTGWIDDKTPEARAAIERWANGQ